MSKQHFYLLSEEQYNTLEQTYRLLNFVTMLSDGLSKGAPSIDPHEVAALCDIVGDKLKPLLASPCHCLELPA